jgi:hypothetical protein
LDLNHADWAIKGGRILMWKWTKFDKILLGLFLLAAPLVRPWVHGDGNGYYGFARAVLFQHNLDFELDWRHGYENDPRVNDPGFRALYLTPNGHFWNHWPIGPAILWSPFLLAARLIMAVVNWFRGVHVAEAGFSRPYMIAMAVGTLFYGFLTLWISFRMARKYVREEWAFLATLGIWLASSFTFYLYLEPSYSHTHSAFLTALFVWLWHETRGKRTWKQWLGLGGIAGLMMDTYYPNALVLLLPAMESFWGYWSALRLRSGEQFARIAANNLVFAGTALALFFPSLLVKRILWGSYFQMGFREHWYWNSPYFFRVGFSSHGAFSWTPILILAVAGLFLLRKSDRALSNGLLGVLLAFTYFIGCYEGWHAIPSFGNRFFITFTVCFILGLGVLMNELERLWYKRAVFAGALAAIGLLMVWNCGLMYQFAFRLFPQEGDVSWSRVAYNQVAVVPGEVAHLVRTSLARRLGGKASDEKSSAQPSLPAAELQR